MRQFVQLPGRTPKGDLTAQPQRLRYRPRRPAKLLYQLKSSVQGEKSPAHTLDRGDAFRFTCTFPSAWITVRVRRPFDFVCCPHSGQATSSYLPSPCCNNNSPSISPINSRRNSATLPAISSKVACGRSSPHATSRQHLLCTAHKFRLGLFSFHFAPLLLPFALPISTPSLPPFILAKIWDAPLVGVHPRFGVEMVNGDFVPAVAKQASAEREHRLSAITGPTACQLVSGVVESTSWQRIRRCRC